MKDAKNRIALENEDDLRNAKLALQEIELSGTISFEEMKK